MKKVTSRVAVMASKENVFKIEMQTKMFLLNTVGGNTVFNSIEVWSKFTKNPDSKT